MKIIYNDSKGALIYDFRYEGRKLPPHYPAGNIMPDKTISNGLMQYEDDIADLLLSTFGFLYEVDADRAKQILEKKIEEFRCDYPGCNFVTTKAIALKGHQRSHENKKKIKSTEKPVVEESLIPVAQSEISNEIWGKQSEGPQPIDGREIDIQNGEDKDGVQWYGDGVTVENKSAQAFSGTKPAGKGHFKG